MPEKIRSDLEGQRRLATRPIKAGNRRIVNQSLKAKQQSRAKTVKMNFPTDMCFSEVNA
jgi:hypothetical protein